MNKIKGIQSMRLNALFRWSWSGYHVDAMKRAILLSLSVAAVLFSGWYGWNFLLDAEGKSFHAISEGDTEERLVKVLRWRGVDYRKSHERGGATIYSHGDGFIGICFYYVEDGRVFKKVVD